MGQFTLLSHLQTVNMLKESMMIIALVVATVHGYSIGKREAEPGYGYGSYSSGYNLGNDDHSYNYGHQQHSVHKRSPQIPGLRIFGTKAALAGTLGSFGLEGLSAAAGTGSLTGLGAGFLGLTKSFIFG